jgi:hypothetical protein
MGRAQLQKKKEKHLMEHGSELQYLQLSKIPTSMLLIGTYNVHKVLCANLYIIALESTASHKRVRHRTREYGITLESAASQCAQSIMCKPIHHRTRKYGITLESTGLCANLYIMQTYTSSQYRIRHNTRKCGKTYASLHERVRHHTRECI